MGRIGAFLAVTVGTSLLNNAATRKGLIPRDWAMLAPDDPRQDDVAAAPVEPLLSYALAEPEECCAELNTVVKFKRRFPAFLSGVRATLYATDTGQGRLCGEVLRRAFCHVVGGECSVELSVVEGFGRDFPAGLLGLAKAIAADIREARRRGEYPYVVATGGYKPESTFAVLAAYMAGALGAVYVHESFRDVVLLPFLPLELHGALREYAEGRITEAELARRLGVDPLHLVGIGLIDEKGELNPIVATLLDTTAH